MKKLLIITALALTACTAKAPLYQEVVRSEMSRHPEASYIDGQEGNLKWNYTTGLELKAMLDAVIAEAASVVAEDAPAVFGPYEQEAGASSTTTAKTVLKYVNDWYDAIIDSTGAIGGKYKKSNYSLDHICPGCTLFQLYDLTGKEKYRAAIDTLYLQLKEQPRTADGGFWHKKVYPEQMWLDGLYMAQPFYAEYTMRYIPEPQRQENIDDITRQFALAFEHCYDTNTKLLRHAWDSSHSMFWCDPATGQSAHAWGRAMGWYCMALVDVIGILSKDSCQELIGILTKVLDALRDNAAPSTGLWYQVLDRPGEEGNYLEATCNAMFSYAFSKAVTLGISKDKRYARRLYKSMVRTFVTTDNDNDLVNLEQCCEVAGLGGKQNRSGDYEYYIHERVRANDPKGIGPLIWASIEYEKL
ncbi:MAG: glycoside hydrolase family 88 protein [Bacteroidales bacterium]|nr:glycoside hydrolase family 88 protein [Bacteroidales bacterium]